MTWTAAVANGGATITGYEAQYRKKGRQMRPPPRGRLTPARSNSARRRTTFNLANLEAGATYEAQVRAVTSDEGAGPWSDTGEGTANTATEG